MRAPCRVHQATGSALHTAGTSIERLPLIGLMHYGSESNYACDRDSLLTLNNACPLPDAVSGRPSQLGRALHQSIDRLHLIYQLYLQPKTDRLG